MIGSAYERVQPTVEPIVGPYRDSAAALLASAADYLRPRPAADAPPAADASPTPPTEAEAELAATATATAAAATAMAATAPAVAAATEAARREVEEAAEERRGEETGARGRESGGGNSGKRKVCWGAHCSAFVCHVFTHRHPVPLHSVLRIDPLPMNPLSGHALPSSIPTPFVSVPGIPSPATSRSTRKDRAKGQRPHSPDGARPRGRAGHCRRDRARGRGGGHPGATARSESERCGAHHAAGLRDKDGGGRGTRAQPGGSRPGLDGALCGRGGPTGPALGSLGRAGFWGTLLYRLGVPPVSKRCLAWGTMSAMSASAVFFMHATVLLPSAAFFV